VRIRRGLAVAFATLVSTSTLLAGPLQGVATADAPVLFDPAAWTSFLAGHPELTSGAGVGGSAVAACEAVVTCPAGVALGAFALSFTGTTAVLHYVFNSGGDARPVMTGANATVQLNTAPYTNWGVYGTLNKAGWDCTATTCPPPSPSTSSTWAAAYAVSATVTVTAYNKCVDGTGSSTVMGPNSQGLRSSLGNCAGHGGTLVAGLVEGSHPSDAATATPRDAWWAVDTSAGAGWTVRPHVECQLTGGGAQVVDGTPITVTPGPNVSVDWTMPSCPSGATPRTEYVTGGRTGVDPTTQVVAAAPTTAPQVGATSSTSTSGGTSTTTTTTGNNPATGDPGSDNCMSSFWSWNPVAWVFTPVKCALTWAFVPSSTDVQSAHDSMNGGWSSTRGLGGWAASIGGAVTALGGLASSAGNDCAGPSFTVHLAHIDAPNMRPLYACAPPLDKVAIACKVLLSIGMVLYGIRICSRALRSSIGLGDAA
jgi:hypothetical protein